MSDYTVRVKTYDQRDPRLGRNVVHDSRSLLYQAPARDPRTLKSARHRINIPTLNQGQIGSCTGNAGTHDMGSDEQWGAGSGVLSTTDNSANQRFAVGVYSDATAIDPWAGQYPPTDTGSDGLSVAKVLKARGLISGFTHATSLNAALTGLADGLVLIGSEWYEDMFYPGPDGKLSITGALAGGHEYVLDELDVERQRVWVHNSWGDEWGVDGRAWMTWDNLGTLLSRNGDCTILVPLTEPPPFPVDPDEPVDPDTDLDQDMVRVTKRMLKRTDDPNYFSDVAVPWIKSKEKP